MSSTPAHASELPAEISLGPLWTESGETVCATVRDVSTRLEKKRARRKQKLSHPDGRPASTPSTMTPACAKDSGSEDEITAFDEATAQTEQERRRAEWTAMVVHDLRQPVTAIIFESAALSLTACNPEKVRARAEAIAHSAHRLDRMIRELLELSRLDASRLELQPETVALEPLVRAAVARVVLGDIRRVVTVHMHGELPVIRADPDRVEQILDNLLDNAFRHGDRTEPDVTVDLESNGNDVIVAVTNRGTGIDPEEQAQLFQRFRRVRSSCDADDSTGLGLCITKSLVEAHGGRIEVASTPGTTTTFRFTLPVECPSSADTKSDPGIGALPLRSRHRP